MSLIVIVGINGRQGTSVAEAFMKIPGTLIRGLTSSPDCPASERWQSMGVEIREETWDDEEHVKASFKGAAVIFALTSYHASFGNRRARLAFEVGMINTYLERFAMKCDIHIGRTILNAAAATQGLRRLVMPTLPVVNEGASYASARAHSAYLAKRQHLIYLETCLPALLKKTIVVKPVMRMEDYLATLRMSGNGKLSFGTTVPAHVPLPWLNMKDDFGIFVRALVSNISHGFVNIAAFSDWRSGNEICALISRISGIPCEYRRYRVDEIEALGNNLASDMLPDLSGSVPYDPKIFTPACFNEAFRTHGVSVPQSSFEDYLKTVLHGHIASLKGTAILEVRSSNQVAPLREEESPLAMSPASRLDRSTTIQNPLIRDVFMGYLGDNPEEDLVGLQDRTYNEDGARI